MNATPIRVREARPGDEPAIRVREAGPGDETAIVRLFQEFARTNSDTSPLTEEFVREYMSSPGSHILLAEGDGQPVGVLSYSIQPDLYHAGPAALIEELFVRGPAQGRGVGSALMADLLSRLAHLGCVVVSVAAMPDNVGAIRFYRAHGLVDEAVLLEKHF
jgi:ribosomal protein S18 acetylase RimI-like enzyme